MKSAKKHSYLVEYIDRYRRWKQTHRDQEDEDDDSPTEDRCVIAIFIMPGVVYEKKFWGGGGARWN